MKRISFVWTLLAGFMLIACGRSDDLVVIGEDLPQRDGFARVCVRASMPGYDSPTRLEMVGDKGCGLKSTWTLRGEGHEGDRVSYCYRDADGGKHYVDLLCVKMCESHRDGASHAWFEGYIPDGETGRGLVEFFDNPQMFVAAVVVPSGSRNISLEEGGRIVIDGLDSQDGTLGNLGEFDLLYTNKSLEKDFDSDGEHVKLHFRHSRFAYLHLPFHSDHLKGEKVEKVFFNYYPAMGRGGVSSENAFLKKLVVGRWDDEKGVLKNDEKTYNNVSVKNDDVGIGLEEVNVLRIDETPLKFDADGDLDLFLVAASGRIAGRFCVQIKTKNNLVSNMFYVKSAFADGELVEHGVVFKAGKCLRLDTREGGRLRDNAVGMFLLENGHYSPVPGRDILQPENELATIGVCCSNRPVGESKVNDFFSKPDLTSDFLFSHYAMSLISKDVENFGVVEVRGDGETVFPHNKDEDVFKFCIPADYRDRWGRQNSLIFDYCDFGRLEGGDGCLNVLDELDGRIKRNDMLISKMFIPSVGQLYLLMANVPVTMMDGQLLSIGCKGENRFERNRRRFSLHGDDLQCAARGMLSYYGVLGNVQKICSSSTDIYSRAKKGVVYCFDSLNMYVSDYGPQRFHLIPFFAFKSMTNSTDDDWYQILDWRVEFGATEHKDNSNNGDDFPY